MNSSKIIRLKRKTTTGSSSSRSLNDSIGSDKALTLPKMHKKSKFAKKLQVITLGTKAKITEPVTQGLLPDIKIGVLEQNLTCAPRRLRNCSVKTRMNSRNSENLLPVQSLGTRRKDQKLDVKVSGVKKGESKDTLKPNPVPRLSFDKILKRGDSSFSDLVRSSSKRSSNRSSSEISPRQKYVKKSNRKSERSNGGGLIKPVRTESGSSFASISVSKLDDYRKGFFQSKGLKTRNQSKMERRQRMRSKFKRNYIRTASQQS